jgi:hypothetical protein
MLTTSVEFISSSLLCSSQISLAKALNRVFKSSPSRPLMISDLLAEYQRISVVTFS